MNIATDLARDDALDVPRRRNAYGRAYDLLAFAESFLRCLTGFDVYRLPPMVPRAICDYLTRDDNELFLRLLLFFFQIWCSVVSNMSELSLLVTH